MNSDNVRYILVAIIKVLLVILGMLFLFVIGTAVGYGMIGKGNTSDVFSGQIWDHIYSFLH